MRRFAGMNFAGIVVLLALFAPACPSGQPSMLKIVGTDRLPVPFALVSVDRGIPKITDEQGELSLGTERQKAIGVLIRRIGYRVLADTIDLPDTATIITLTLSREPQNPSPVMVSGTPQKSQLELVGFYDRWLQAQREGGGSGYIGPEAIELRNAAVTTDLLDPLVTLRVSGGIRSARGIGKRPQIGAPITSVAPASANDLGECFLNVVIDKRAVCPNVGCHYVFADDPPGSTAADHSVDLDKLLSPRDIAGIEVTGNAEGTPGFIRNAEKRTPDFIRNADNGCGVIVIWTKRRE
jgi:hypothetical protein